MIQAAKREFICSVPLNGELGVIDMYHSTVSLWVSDTELQTYTRTVEPGYNIGLCDTSSIASDILWYQLILHC
jgi:hypothetical protein